MKPRLRAPLAFAFAAALLLAPAAGAQTWTELGDAPSFPAGTAQVTRGATLSSIVGATGVDDPRDAYCVRVVDPGAFRATTDPAVDASASADFNTRLLLFDAHGAAVLANDDTPPGGATVASTVTGTATDGSGFALERAAELVLVVAGFEEAPEDGAATGLFDFGAGLGLVHAADPAAGRFAAWAGAGPATGAYSVALQGVIPCQEDLDVVAANAFGEESRVCRGNATGIPRSCGPVSDSEDNASGLAAGFLDDDAHLDLVVANYSLRDQVCLSDGQAGFVSCSDVDTATAQSTDVALADFDGDSHPDAVFSASFQPDLFCAGDGNGGFSPCVALDVDAPETDSLGVAVGHVDADAHLDVVVAVAFAPHRLCLGDGRGGFSCSDMTPNDVGTRGVALGYVDGDSHLDAVFANAFAQNEVCLGDGGGGFSCSPFDRSTGLSTGVALGDLDGDGDLDAVISNANSGANRVCLGSGDGGFPSCADVSEAEVSTEHVALGLVDADAHLDAVFADYQAAKTVCFGDGAGGFGSCVELEPLADETTEILLAELGAPDPTIFTDGFESGDTSSWSSTVQ